MFFSAGGAAHLQQEQGLSSFHPICYAGHIPCCRHFRRRALTLHPAR